jgi:hypothetical protein
MKKKNNDKFHFTAEKVLGKYIHLVENKLYAVLCEIGKIIMRKDF